MKVIKDLSTSMAVFLFSAIPFSILFDHASKWLRWNMAQERFGTIFIFMILVCAYVKNVYVDMFIQINEKKCTKFNKKEN